MGKNRYIVMGFWELSNTLASYSFEVNLQIGHDSVKQNSCCKVPEIHRILMWITLKRVKTQINNMPNLESLSMQKWVLILTVDHGYKSFS